VIGGLAVVTIGVAFIAWLLIKSRHQVLLREKLAPTCVDPAQTLPFDGRQWYGQEYKSGTMLGYTCEIGPGQVSEMGATKPHELGAERFSGRRELP
jgi:hypothetical protein